MASTTATISVEPTKATIENSTENLSEVKCAQRVLSVQQLPLQLTGSSLANNADSRENSSSSPQKNYEMKSVTQASVTKESFAPQTSSAAATATSSNYNDKLKGDVENKNINNPFTEDDCVRVTTVLPKDDTMADITTYDSSNINDDEDEKETDEMDRKENETIKNTCRSDCTGNSAGTINGGNGAVCSGGGMILPPPPPSLVSPAPMDSPYSRKLPLRPVAVTNSRAASTSRGTADANDRPISGRLKRDEKCKETEMTLSAHFGISTPPPEHYVLLPSVVDDSETIIEGLTNLTSNSNFGMSTLQDDIDYSSHVISVKQKQGICCDTDNGITSTIIRIEIPEVHSFVPSSSYQEGYKLGLGKEETSPNNRNSLSSQNRNSWNSQSGDPSSKRKSSISACGGDVAPDFVFDGTSRDRTSSRASSRGLQGLVVTTPITSMGLANIQGLNEKVDNSHNYTGSSKDTISISSSDASTVKGSNTTLLCGCIRRTQQPSISNKKVLGSASAARR